MTVGIVTDSSCDLSDSDLEGLDIEIVPLTVRFGPEEFFDRKQINADEFYQKMASSEHFPQTSTPSPGNFMEAFRSHLDKGHDAIVYISLSSKISATMQAGVQAAEELEGDIRVVDSQSVSAGLGTIVLEAARLAANGADADEIVAAAEDASQRTRLFAALQTLENLKRGGRIGGAQAMLGSMLSIKPIIDLSSGEVKEAGRQRTRKKALMWLCNRVKESMPIKHLSIVHGQADDVGDFHKTLATAADDDNIKVGIIGPIVGAHAGAGVMAVTYQVVE